jgi:hypothetical protein
LLLVAPARWNVCGYAARASGRVCHHALATPPLLWLCVEKWVADNPLGDFDRIWWRTGRRQRPNVRRGVANLNQRSVDGVLARFSGLWGIVSVESGAKLSRRVVCGMRHLPSRSREPALCPQQDIITTWAPPPRPQFRIPALLRSRKSQNLSMNCDRLPMKRWGPPRAAIRE